MVKSVTLLVVEEIQELEGGHHVVKSDALLASRELLELDGDRNR